MEKRNTTPAPAELNINVLLSSKEFENIVVKIASSFGINKHNDLYNDVKQACAIAVIDAFDKYDAEKCGGNFWGYAYPRMYEYGKNEVANQRELVHIPYNRRNGTGKYEKISHEYYDLVRPNDGHAHDEYLADDYIEVEEHDCNAGLSMDIAAALDSLNKEQREVFELMNGLREMKNENANITYGNVANELGVNIAVVRRRYNSALEAMREYLA